MTVRCSVCSHPKRAEIERGLRNSLSYRELERRFSVSRSSIDRHAKKCLGGVHSLVMAAAPVLSGDIEIIRDVEYSDDPVKLLDALTRANLDGFNMMRRRGDDTLAAVYQRELRAGLAMKIELETERASRPPEEMSPTRLRIVQEARNRNDAMAREIAQDAKLTSVLTNIKERLEAKKAAAGLTPSPVIDLQATPQPTPVENSGGSPVRTRMRGSVPGPR